MTITREKTREALVKSIEHWRENENVVHPEDAKILSGACALCELFLDEIEIDDEGYPSDCAGCPVKRETGRAWCAGSPWPTAYDAARLIDLPRFKIAAKAEREFLEMLLAKMDAEDAEKKE